MASTEAFTVFAALFDVEERTEMNRPVRASRVTHPPITFDTFVEPFMSFAPSAFPISQLIAI